MNDRQLARRLLGYMLERGWLEVCMDDNLAITIRIGQSPPPDTPEGIRTVWEKMNREYQRRGWA